MGRDISLIVLSPPVFVEREIELVIQLFELGMTCFHLRKLQAQAADLVVYLQQIPERFHAHIVLHQAYELLDTFDLKGVHLTTAARAVSSKAILHIQITAWQTAGKSISCSAHSLNELNVWGEICDYILLSPVFDSISKVGYLANPNLEVQNINCSANIIALGGITTTTARLAQARAFDGVAVLGYLWQDPDLAIARFFELSALNAS